MTLTDPEAVLQPGQVVHGKYEVERLIAIGGMAAIWAGRNRLTGKRVALKVVLRSLVGKPDVLARFRREALAAGRIHHPNVVTVFDVVEHQGLPCMVMELLEGETLMERIDRMRRLDPADLVDLLLPVMSALQAAHDLGIVHRDLKPHNVFVCRETDGTVVGTKVLDFGISKIREDHANPQAITLAGTIMGTPAYMAPEQLVSTTGADHRVDVYALGIVMYQALAGVTPFTSDSPSELMVRIATEPPPPLETLRPDVPYRLKVLIERAIAKKPEKRFASVAQFAKALRDWRNNDVGAVATPVGLPPAVVSMPEERTERLARRPPPRRGPLIAVVVAAATAGVGLLVWNSFARPIRAPLAPQPAPGSSPPALPASSTSVPPTPAPPAPEPPPAPATAPPPASTLPPSPSPELAGRSPETKPARPKRAAKVVPAASQPSPSPVPPAPAPPAPAPATVADPSEESRPPPRPSRGPRSGTLAPGDF